MFAAADDEALDVLARDRLVRFENLTLMTAGASRAVGLELRPTFRRPHYTIVLPYLDDSIDRLSACENVRWRNPHFLGPEGGRSPSPRWSTSAMTESSTSGRSPGVVDGRHGFLIAQSVLARRRA